ncbi:hypothetical protein ID866_8061 [Astraeus odoratus]|nr:hypothetical protein ID866_8061 [Astraeus odoratus]
MSSPALEAVRQDVTKEKSKKKKSKASPVVIAEHGKNEGDDPHWAYQPPPGAVLLDHAVGSDQFEWDTIKDNDDLELWLIRVPDSIKAKNLEGLEIDPPFSSRTARVGSLARKNVTHDIWSIGDDHPGIVGGDELRGLSCLLPRKRKKGKLCIAPKPIARHLVVSAQPTAPTPPEHSPIVHQNPARPSYPRDVLKHHFVPYGARSQGNGTTLEETMEVDTMPAVGAAPHEITSTKQETKGRKRKTEGESPKKSKKHKSKD